MPDPDPRFNVAATVYDAYMGAWSEPLSAQLVDVAGVAASQRVLDVGCGPGSLTTELVRRLGASYVAAVDPSEPFVAAARARNPGVDVRQASAEALPYPDGAFDAALAQLVVHFMADPVAGLREMARVTRPGGLVAACVWDFGGGRGPLGPFWEAAREVDRAVVDESGLAGARHGHLAELLEAAGLSEIGESELRVERGFDGFDEWWEPFTHGVGPAGAFAASLDPERRVELRERCRSSLPGGAFALKAVAWAAQGSAEPP
jgi:SAM-dependent methyltransferase